MSETLPPYTAMLQVTQQVLKKANSPETTREELVGLIETLCDLANGSDNMCAILKNGNNIRDEHIALLEAEVERLQKGLDKINYGLQLIENMSGHYH